MSITTTENLAETSRRAAEESQRQEEERQRLETLEGAGFIAMTYETHGSGINQNMAAICIHVIDPETGDSKQVRHFPIKNTSDYSLLIGNNPRFMFDENYRRLAATRRDTQTNVNHIGWITEDGSFFDITAKLFSNQSDFSVTPHLQSLGFGVDGYYYYTQARSGKFEAYMRVPVNNVTPTAAEVVLQGPTHNTSTDLVVQHMQETNNKNHLMSPLGATDWLNETQCIMTEYEESGFSGKRGKSIFVCDGNQYANPYTDWKKTPNRTEIIPNMAGRRSWGGIASPDGAQIVFLSCLSQGSEAAELFVVPSTGGEPKKVSSEITFARDGAHTTDALLIGWR
jgi:hypothetical protein